MREHIQLICGGREFADRAAMRGHISALAERVGSECQLVIMAGGARGADRLASQVATEMGLRTVEVPAEWDRYGRSAGYKRNVVMAERLLEAQSRGATVEVVAFPGGAGTAHMIEIARERGLAVTRKVRRAVA